jgi:hypothetical protein
MPVIPVTQEAETASLEVQDQSEQKVIYRDPISNQLSQVWWCTAVIPDAWRHR